MTILVTMPETAMYKNDCPVFRKDNIWFTWITFIVFSIAKPFREQEFADNFFRFGIRTLNSGHIETASFRWMIIGHCANHPHHNKQRIEVPLGPVFINEDREIWLLPPKSEEITIKLLDLLNSITNEVQKRYPSPTDLEEVIIDQLMTGKVN